MVRTGRRYIELKFPDYAHALRKLSNYISYQELLWHDVSNAGNTGVNKYGDLR